MRIFLLALTSVMLLIGLTTPSILAQELPTDQTQLNDMISKSFDYVHKADISTSTMTILLHGVTLSPNDFILLYDSTPYVSKGHFAANLPCDPKDPYHPIFEVLVGRAPNLFVMPIGYIEKISTPPRICVYHGQFGFGAPITDIALKYTGDTSITFEGPHSVVISTHEFYKPATQSFQEQHHNSNVNKSATQSLQEQRHNSTATGH